ncbi:MFS antiporter QDR3 [Cytospora mali]|uniref:MFS antiporter QDR3 n=1 Tax=Cytospora mali TaxID=578113 RepID=A0A194VDL4_CYTMA|nr:MFS antiporter QDR3 [Valsa mali var. pyri (nom. inval.)]
MSTQDNHQSSPVTSKWPFFGKRTTRAAKNSERDSDEEDLQTARKAPKWSFGVLNDPQTIEVPGSVLLLSDHRNEPLGLRNAPARTSHSSIPAGVLHEPPPRVESENDEKKKTSDGKIILEPQPEDSANDPLNWPTWRRDSALVSLGLYCMVGGGMTPILAAGFTNVAEDYGVSVSQVSLTTGLYMMGMGLGSVIASPTAILYGKRPVYLVSAVLFIVTSVWCALSPNFTSLILARIFQGVSVSPVECLPSATIAEIFFLHERAFRIGIYTLLLLGGKNLVPLVSAAIMQSLSWRWVFWIVALVVAFCGILLFVFVPETFWDRTPHPRPRTHSRPNFFRRISSKYVSSRQALPHDADVEKPLASPDPEKHQKPHKDVRFASESEPETGGLHDSTPREEHRVASASQTPNDYPSRSPESKTYSVNNGNLNVPHEESHKDEKAQKLDIPSTGTASPTTATTHGQATPNTEVPSRTSSLRSYLPWSPSDPERQRQEQANRNPYSSHWREQEAKNFIQQLRPWHGRLNKDSWLKVMVRPLILFSYPSVLWSAVVYSCSVGWLIVLSESVAVIYRQGYYKFNALQTGLIYISPFIGGVLGTAVAGKVSDIIVKAMSRRNGGLYEPEFRLVMALPVAVTTVIGLMGFGWSAQVHDQWIVPTVFFGIVSFGCSLGSTTSITFCVDSYRQYAGEALVTLNFSKNIFHGLVFSLFVTGWLESDGAKMVFIWIGVIQLIMLAFSVPMFIYGKRCRMWTVRKNLMEKF